MTNTLRKARLDRGWSQTRMISELHRQARAAGEAIPDHASLKTMLSRWENGHSVPAPVYRRLLGATFDLPLAQLGLPALEDRVEDVDLGLSRPATLWRDDARTASELWDGDMNRRGFLRQASFSTAALTLPVADALLATDRAAPASEVGALAVCRGDVDSIRTMTRALRDLDNRYGGGQARSAAVDYLSKSVTPLLTGARFDQPTGKQLFTAAAELTQLVAWMSFDIGHAGLGQRHLIQAYNLATHAGDDALVGEILAALSHQASYLHAYTEAVDLAQAAGVVARRTGVFALTAEAAVMEAHGHAGRGDTSACMRSIHTAEAALDKDRGNDPDWMSYFDEAYLSAKFGHCFKALGDTAATTRFASKSLHMNTDFARGRVFNLTLLAYSHATAGDVEKACAIGLQATNGAHDLKSRRVKKDLQELRKALRPASDAAAVARLDRALQPVLAA